MSFTAQVKEEIIKKSVHRKGCCNYAELAGILAYSAVFKESRDGVVLQIMFENADVAMRCYNLIRKLFGNIATIEKKQYSTKAYAIQNQSSGYPAAFAKCRVDGYGWCCVSCFTRYYQPKMLQESVCARRIFRWRVYCRP